MNNQPTLGQIIEGTVERDAIHIAIAPVVAAGRVYPGQHVALLDNGPQVAAVLPTDPNRPIGIVDPFLAQPVEAGQQFYLFLYPQTVTNLRHHWTHPAFTAPEPSESERYIRLVADDHGVTYEEILRLAADFQDTGDYAIQGGRWEGMGVRDEFWDHYEKLTGKATINRGGLFSCSC